MLIYIAMGQPLEEIVDRIIICGLAELEDYIRSEKISGIVSVCSSTECLDAISGHDANAPNKKMTAQDLIEAAKSKGVQHYQSLLYEVYGDFLDEEKPYDMSDDEFDTFQYEQAEETLATIKSLLDEDPNKKIIIHCVQGSDRSAMVALALFLDAQGELADIDTALRLLQKIRPQARLESIASQFKSYFGADFDGYRSAIHTYRDTMIAKSELPQSPRALAMLKANKPALISSDQYKENCARFGINPTP